MVDDTDEEAMAAAMEGMGDDPMADDMASAMGEDSTLSQDEIDSLLGFEDATGAATSGIQALLDRSQENYERLPMLEVVFDRFVRSMSTSLRNFTSENVDVNIESITSMKFEDYLNSVPLPALLSIFQAVEWENFGLITIDSSLTYSMVDILLGGGRTHRPVRIEGRPFTTIEQDIVQSLAKLMLSDMSGAFTPLTPASFRLERLETNPRFATITRPVSPVIVVSLRVEMDDRGGQAEILLPYATLEPVKDLLLQMFAGESFGADAPWESHLSSEVMNTYVEIAAILDNKVVTLEDIANLEVGSTIIMNNKPSDDIKVSCGGIEMMVGKMGAIDKNIAISVTSTNKKNIEELI